jgi:predicted nucleic acid-binding protein
MLLDSNLIIYASLPAYAQLREFIAANAPAVSVVSVIEVLGYHRLTPLEGMLFREFFATTLQLPVDDRVVDRAIALRQLRRLSLGDSLIAATALIHGRTLLTHNAQDFASIDGLTVIDPLT